MSPLDFDDYCPDCGDTLTPEVNILTGQAEPYCWNCGTYKPETEA